MTPFEKNIEVWRQLWRVTEKADIVVQVRIGVLMLSKIARECIKEYLRLL